MIILLLIRIAMAISILEKSKNFVKGFPGKTVGLDLLFLILIEIFL